MKINLIYSVLRDSKTKSFIETNYDPFGYQNIPIISVVTLGEIDSLAKRNLWGDKRVNAVKSFLQKCVIVDINSNDVIDKYGEIDTYSQGKHPNKKNGFSSRNMGKNDLWIAATASALNATLLTTDKDFAHLEDVF